MFLAGTRNGDPASNGEGLLEAVVAELRTTETLTEGFIILLVLETFIPFSLTLIPVPSVAGVDPNEPVLQFTIPMVITAVLWVGVAIRRTR